MAALLIPGLAFFSALVLIALANTANVHTKAQTESQQTFWQFLGDALTGRTVVHQITQATRTVVSRFALAQLKPVTAWFVALNVLLRQVFATQATTAEQTATAVERLRGHTIPQAVGKAVAPAKSQASAAHKAAAHAQATASSTSTALHRYQVRTDPKIAHATVAVDVAIPQQLGRIRTRVGTAEGQIARDTGRIDSLEHGAERTWEWIRTHPLSAVTGAFTAAVGIALSRLGFGFLRCRSWRNVGKGVTCGMGDDLGALLGLAATAAAVSQFRELVKLAQAVEHETAVGIKDLAGL